MYSLIQIKRELDELCHAAGLQLNVPVTINGRLTKTHGRFTYHWKNGKIEPLSLEFSKLMLETAAEASIIDVIKHEWVHWYLAVMDPTQDHGHDAAFKTMCHKINCSLDTGSGQLATIVPKEHIHKYSVYCHTCGDKFVAGYDRMGHILKNLDECYCKACGTSTLYYVQNR